IPLAARLAHQAPGRVLDTVEHPLAHLISPLGSSGVATITGTRQHRLHIRQQDTVLAPAETYEESCFSCTFALWDVFASHTIKAYNEKAV
ncbi:hypothetical protein, partial [Bifidobacterium sp. SO1]|uniref:hypothetical protein n=1 Tax=Bifidobacterium sp. SO1 TaxID=2809029 RepID=UPI001BDC3AF4